MANSNKIIINTAAILYQSKFYKVDKYYKDIHKNKNENIKMYGNENDQYYTN
jgi:hypothetical protein